jgi:hypothetical protein
VNMAVKSVSDHTEYELSTPDGMLRFSSAIPVEAGWTIAHTGETQSVLFDLVDIGDMQYWLTTSGWSASS